MSTFRGCCAPRSRSARPGCRLFRGLIKILAPPSGLLKRRWAISVSYLERYPGIDAQDCRFHPSLRYSLYAGDGRRACPVSRSKKLNIIATGMQTIQKDAPDRKWAM